MRKRLKLEFIINVTDRDIDNIVKMAEIGTKHWCDTAHWCKEVIFHGPRYDGSVAEQMIHGGLVKLHSKIGDRDHYLTHAELIYGLQQYLKNPTDGDFLEFADHELYLDTSRIDENIADAIIQYALFDRILYKQGIRL